MKTEDHPSDEANQLILNLRTFRDDLISEISHNPSKLIRWLYENQGVRRFDASNRLFLVLVKKPNYFDSWKLKRARDLLVDTIHGSIDDFQCNEADQLEFNWDGEVYATTAKAIVIVQ